MLRRVAVDGLISPGSRLQGFDKSHSFFDEFLSALSLFPEPYVPAASSDCRQVSEITPRVLVVAHVIVHLFGSQGLRYASMAQKKTASASLALLLEPMNNTLGRLPSEQYTR